MKRILQSTLILALALAAGTTAMAQLELLPDTPNDTYCCVSHPVPGIVYLSGEQAVYKSYDNGDFWEAVYTFGDSLPNRFFGMWFLDEQTGFATCAKSSKSVASLRIKDPSLSLLYKTVNGGVSWQCIDTVHSFTNIQFVNHDTLFALEQNQGALFKTEDGGFSWNIVLDGRDLCDYSIVDGQVLYALHGTSYVNDWNGSTNPDPIVYKTIDGGDHWITIRPTDSSRGPRTMNQLFFHQNKAGVILGHDVMHTEDDFSTYEIVSAGVPSTPEVWGVQYSTLKSGFQTATSWNPFDMSGYSLIRVSKDYGIHGTTVGSIHFPCESTGCEKDTTFFIVTLNNVYRLFGSNFPNVGLPGHEKISFSVSPNPASSQFMISCEVPFSRIEVFDCQGRVVHLQTGEQQCGAIVNISNWDKGLYILVVHTIEGNVTTKIVKS